MSWLSVNTMTYILLIQAWTLFFFVFGSPVEVRNSSQDCELDIVFVVDDSLQNGRIVFQRQLHFIKKVIKLFEARREHVDVGIMTFGTSPRKILELGHGLNTANISRLIDAIPIVNVSRLTPTVYNMLREMMLKTKHREHSEKVAVLFVNSFPRITVQITNAAKQAKREGITIIPVVLNSHSSNAAQQVSADTEDGGSVFVPKNNAMFADDFIAFTKLKACKTNTSAFSTGSGRPATTPAFITGTAESATTPAFITGTAESAATPTFITGTVQPVDIVDCSKLGDVVFVLDESSSIWGPDFAMQLKFVKEIIRILNVENNNVNIGVLMFSDQIRPSFHLGEYETTEELNAAIDGIVQNLGNTRTDQALEMLRDTMFAEEHHRQGVAKTAIIITDGESDYPQSTVEQANLTKADGIEIFAIGVSTYREDFVEELIQIASLPIEDHYFHVSNYTALERIGDVLVNRACKDKSTSIATAESTSLFTE